MPQERLNTPRIILQRQRTTGKYREKIPLSPSELIKQRIMMSQVNLSQCKFNLLQLLDNNAVIFSVKQCQLLLQCTLHLVEIELLKSMNYFDEKDKITIAVLDQEIMKNNKHAQIKRQIHWMGIVSLCDSSTPVQSFAEIVGSIQENTLQKLTSTMEDDSPTLLMCQIENMLQNDTRFHALPAHSALNAMVLEIGSRLPVVKAIKVQISQYLINSYDISSNLAPIVDIITGLYVEARIGGQLSHENNSLQQTEHLDSLPEVPIEELVSSINTSDQ